MFIKPVYWAPLWVLSNFKPEAAARDKEKYRAAPVHRGQRSVTARQLEFINTSQREGCVRGGVFHIFLLKAAEI